MLARTGLAHAPWCFIDVSPADRLWLRAVVDDRNAAEAGGHLYAVQIFWEKCAPEAPVSDGSCDRRPDGQPRIGESGVSIGFGGTLF